MRLPSDAEARRIRGIEYPDYVPSTEPGPNAILCGALGPPCFHCGGLSDALCDFPLGEEGRTCDRALCLSCAPNVGLDGVVVPQHLQSPEADYKNYCHDHDEHGRNMLLFPTPKRTMTPPGAPPPRRAKPLPKAPPEHQRWRVRQGRGDPDSHGAVLTSWMTQIGALAFARRVGGYVETWDQFVKLWRTLYPLKSERKPKPRSRR